MEGYSRESLLVQHYGEMLSICTPGGIISIGATERIPSLHENVTVMREQMYQFWVYTLQLEIYAEEICQ